MSWLAIVLTAKELRVLKSIPPQANQCIGGWLGKLAMANYVDEWIPLLGVELPPIVFKTLTTTNDLS
jgi:hypothetical protein